MGQHGAELPGRGSGLLAALVLGGPARPLHCPPEVGTPPLSSPPGVETAPQALFMHWGPAGPGGEQGESLAEAQGLTSVGSQGGHCWEGDPWFTFQGTPSFLPLPQPGPQRAGRTPRFSHCRRTWPASPWCGHSSWDPPSTLHTLLPGRKYENAIPTVINMMNLLCRLPRKIPFRGGDGCAPGALQGGHPPATRPGEIDGHPWEVTRPCLHSVSQTMWFCLKPLRLFQRLHGSGQLSS